MSQIFHNESNVIKTMIIVCALYAVLWLPESVYYLMANLDADLTFLESGYYAVLFVSFLVYLFHSPGDATRLEYVLCTWTSHNTY